MKAEAHYELERVRRIAASLALAVLIGHVIDKTTGQPLPGVTVRIGAHQAVSDAHGNYRLTGLAPGRYTLSASSDDVPSQRRSVVVKPSAQTTFDLTLCSTTLDYSCAGAGSGPGPG